MRHLLMCRVIMGKSERGDHSNSGEFDSGVDNPVAPRKYFVSSSLMNSHILPVYVVSFKAPGDVVKYVAPTQKMINFLDLLPVLARSLSASKMEVLYNLRDDCKEKKISLAEMLREVKRQVDRKVLEDAIKLVKPREGPGSAGTVNLSDLIRVLRLWLPALKMAVLEKLRGDFWAKKISLAELDRRVRLVVDKNVLVSAMKLVKPVNRVALLMVALSRFLPRSQIEILRGLIMDFKGKKISGEEMDRKFKLVVDDNVK